MGGLARYAAFPSRQSVRLRPWVFHGDMVGFLLARERKARLLRGLAVLGSQQAAGTSRRHQ
jgi:hypothetical protein